VPIQWVLTLSTALFCIGIYGVLARRNAVIVLMSVEVMINAVNLNFIAFNNIVPGTRLIGQVFALFVITIAAAELGVGLAIVLLVYRNRFTVSLDEVNLLKW
jgi:NAD(P)H-quinone oxidoreductase subunit 4L